MDSESNKVVPKRKSAAYRNAWKKEHQKCFKLTYSKKSDVDVIERLSSIEARSQYVAKLIREDMRREKEKK